MKNIYKNINFPFGANFSYRSGLNAELGHLRSSGMFKSSWFCEEKSCNRHVRKFKIGDFQILIFWKRLKIKKPFFQNKV